MGKGLLTINPSHSENMLMSNVALGGILTVLLAATEMESLLMTNYSYLSFYLGLAMYPRMLLTVRTFWYLKFVIGKPKAWASPCTSKSRPCSWCCSTSWTTKENNRISNSQYTCFDRIRWESRIGNWWIRGSNTNYGEYSGCKKSWSLTSWRWKLRVKSISN